MRVNNLEMSMHVARLRKATTTDRARVWLLARVRPPMFGESGEIAETFLAHRALVRLLACVYALVCFQAGTLNKIFATHFALVSATVFALVSPYMSSVPRTRMVFFAAIVAVIMGIL